MTKTHSRHFCISVVAALWICSNLSADVIQTFDATAATVTQSPSGFSYTISGANFSFAASAGTGPDDFYSGAVPLSITLPGTNVSISQPLSASGPLVVNGGSVQAYYFGLALVTPSGASSFSPASDVAATYTFPAIVQGSFLACSFPGYQLCQTNGGTLPANAPAVATIAVTLPGVETFTVAPTTIPNAFTYHLSFAATSIPEPASIRLFFIAGLGVVGYRLRQSAQTWL